MRGGLALLCAVASAAEHFSCPSLPPAGVRKSDQHYVNRPQTDCAFTFIGGKQSAHEGTVVDVTSPIFDVDTGERVVIGRLPAMADADALKAVHAAAAAWDKGQGEWPQMPLSKRIDAIERLVEELKQRRSEIVNQLVWEIAKTSGDAAKEFDRTMEFIAAVITELKTDPSLGTPFNEWSTVSGGAPHRTHIAVAPGVPSRSMPHAHGYVHACPCPCAYVNPFPCTCTCACKYHHVMCMHMLCCCVHAMYMTCTFARTFGCVVGAPWSPLPTALPSVMIRSQLTRLCVLAGAVGVRVRRGPIGVMLGLAPFNYPLNEMYAMLIPALLMGNTAVLKLPAIGGLVHCLTARAFSKVLPPGVINFVSGSGRATMGPIMATGLVDALGFIGGTKGADALIKQHPAPHRLKVFAQLEGKNIGIVLPDADVDKAVSQCVLGGLSYNGQRCTAIKLIMVHENIADTFVEKLAAKVSSLKAGLPWEDGVEITPLPESSKPKYLEELISEAVSKGASLVNEAGGGGELAGALFKPAVLDRVTTEMRIFHEEQFGPVVPVARFNDINEVYEAIKSSWNGQQAAIFTSSAASAGPVVDVLSTVVGRININAQCGRSPDSVPFSGRRSSAMGTMSVIDALRAFSVETVVAYPSKDDSSAEVASGLDSATSFFAPLGA